MAIAPGEDGDPGATPEEPLAEPAPPSAAAAAPTAGSRRRGRLLLLLAVAAWLVVATVTLVAAGFSARAGRATLEELRAGASVATLRSEQGVARLHDAEAHFLTARSRLRSLPVSPLRALPVIGRQLRSADHLSSAGAIVAGTAAAGLDQVRERLEGGLPSGPERARLLADLAEVAGAAEDRLRGVDLGPDEALVGPLADGRAQAAGELSELVASAERARVAAAGLAQLLAGDSTQLLLLGNNAEMRAGSGMFLTVGTLGISDGRLSVGEIVPTNDFQLRESVPIEGDLAERWGWLEPGREWRNLGVTPRYDVTAPLAARMWAAARGQEVDGVLALDVIALQALLRAAGPIQVEGEQLDADNVVQDLLHDQYVGLDLDDPANQEARRGRLAGVARAALEALERPELDGRLLAEELAAAARGRHLLAWSPRAEVQHGWEAMDVDGTLEGDELSIAVLNRGGNKLDPYLQVDAHLQVSPGPTLTEVSVELRLENRVSAEEPSYILGPSPPLEVAPGTYVGLVAANLPGSAGSGRFDGFDQLAVAGSDGPTRVVAVPVEIPWGEERTLTLRFELPPGPGAVRVLPSARTPAISWTGPDRSWQDDHAEVLVW